MPQNTQKLAHRYDLASTRWHSKINDFGFPAAYRQLIKTALPRGGGANVIDLGTGCGDFALAYLTVQASPAKLTLLDISAKMLAVAETRIMGKMPVVNAHLGAIETLPPDVQFDTVICGHMIEHCPNPVQTLTEIYQRMLPGGVFVLAASKPHWCTALIQLIWRNKAFPPAKMINMLRQAGFEDIQHLPFATGLPSRVSAGYTSIKSKRNIKCLSQS